MFGNVLLDLTVAWLCETNEGEAVPWTWHSRAEVHPVFYLLHGLSSSSSKTSPNGFGQTIDVCVEVLLCLGSLPPVCFQPWCRKVWTPWQLVCNLSVLPDLSYLTTASVFLHAHARCRVNDSLNGKEGKGTNGLEHEYIREMLMTENLHGNVNKYYLHAFDWPTWNVFVMETNWIFQSTQCLSSVLNSI